MTINTADSRQEAQGAVRIVVHPYASALPLGCLAFGIGNALLGAFILHWIPLSDTPVFAVMLLAFVAPLEAISCVMAFLSRDSGAATAMGIFASAWIVLGVQLLISNPSVLSPVTGMFLLLLALCLAILARVTFPGKPVLGILLSVAILRSIGAALAQFGIRGSVDVVTATLGFVVALLAFYSAAGLLLEDIKGRPLTMTFRRGPAKAALDGDLQEQMTHIANEAGVRQQL
jgi:succinate-acetate transporter protein